MPFVKQKKKQRKETKNKKKKNAHIREVIPKNGLVCIFLQVVEVRFVIS